MHRELSSFPIFVCLCVCKDCVRQATQNRHSSLPTKSTTTSLQRARHTPRTSLPASLENPSSRASSLSPTPTPTPTPVPAVTPSRNRQLSEIDEEEEKKYEATTSAAVPVASRNDGKRGSEPLGGEEERSRRERGGRQGRGSHRRRQSAADVDTAGMKMRSRENLLQVEHQGSQSRQESPSRRETSRSPSLTPLPGDTKKDSPRTERWKIVNKLKKIALEESPMSSDGETAEKPQQTDAVSSSEASQREREAELESSLDFQDRISAALTSPVQSGSTGEEPASVNITSPLEAILAAMESET